MMSDRDRIRSIGSDNEKAALIIYDGMKLLADALVEAAKALRGSR